MSRPMLLAVDEPAARSGIEGELRKRYGADYEVICEPSGAAALVRLEQVRARGGQVALVLADLRLPDMSGIELMARVGGLDPAAKRALLTDWGDRQVGARLVRAAVLGQVDDWGLKPWQPGDEGFHQLVIGLLHEWAQLHRPGFEAVQVVGERWSARARGTPPSAGGPGPLRPRPRPPAAPYGVGVRGAGRPGLAAAVYGASEG